jgi:hypothetical protein
MRVEIGFQHISSRQEVRYQGDQNAAARRSPPRDDEKIWVSGYPSQLKAIEAPTRSAASVVLRLRPGGNAHRAAPGSALAFEGTAHHKGSEAVLMTLRNRLGLTAAGVLSGFAGGWFGSWAVSANQPILVPDVDEVRFELVGNEPIAGPDGRSLVSGWSVLMFKDRKTDRCYVAFNHFNAIAVEEATACAESRR